MQTHGITTIARRALIGATLLAALAGGAAADVGYLPPQPSADAVAPPNYFMEETAGAQPLAPPSAQQPSPHAYASPLQYPNQSAALVEVEATSPEEFQAVSATPHKPLLLTPPSSDPTGAQRQRLAQPLVTAGASLGIVLGLFLLVVLVMRRGMPQGANSLPKDVVEVLGRAPLVGRQQVHLVRCANKVLLVCVSPGGAQTLTEITDPHEVEQLLIVCRGPSSGGAAFDKILEQFGRPTTEPRGRPFAPRDQESELDFSHLETLQHAGRESRA